VVTDREDLEQLRQLLPVEAGQEAQGAYAVAVEAEREAALAIPVQVDGDPLEGQLEGLDREGERPLLLEGRDEGVEELGDEAVDRLIVRIVEEEGAGRGRQPVEAAWPSAAGAG
jgi:hypothetical protein